jgi:N-acetylglucosamine-6-phosphate deacetylase
MITVLNARALLSDDGIINYPTITLEDGVILSVEAGPVNDSSDLLTNCFFDIHIHGAMGHGFMSSTPDEILEVGRFLATKGVAYYLPTTITGPLDNTLRALKNMADAIDGQFRAHEPAIAARPVGIHLEGPFLSHAKRGAHPSANILTPSIELFERFQEAARGNIRLITLAPELPNAVALIRHATSAGVRVSLGHSNATRDETVRGIAAGATSATHTFNAMRALDHREPGIVGCVLDCDDLYAEMICDGVHVHPSTCRLWLKMKGKHRAILVTDSISATGMGDGSYLVGNFTVTVAGRTCLSDGRLAGSVVTMEQAVANFRSFTGESLSTAVHLASRNPAQMLGMPQLGLIAPGRPANFNIYNEEGRFCSSILNGQRVRC